MGTKEKMMKDLESKKPSNYKGPVINIISRIKNGENISLMKDLLSQLPSELGILKLEKGVGDAVKDFYTALDLVPKSLQDISEFVMKIFFVKQDKEIENIKIASKYCGFVANCTLKKIEKVTVDDKKMSNLAISKSIQDLVKKEQFFSKFRETSKLNNVNSDDLEICDSCPIVQSGKLYDYDFSKPSTPDELNERIIVIKSMTKYSEYFSKVVRTYMIDSDEVQVKNYKILLEALENMIKVLIKPGVKLNEVYSKTVNFIRERNSDIVPNILDIMGYGVGLESKNVKLTITKDCEEVIKSNMVLTLYLCFQNLVDKKGNKYWLQLGDTILIQNDKNIVLTDEVKKGTSDIYFNLEVNEEEESASEVKKSSKMEIDEEIINNNDRNAPITRHYVQKKKSEKNGENINYLQQMKEHQLELLEQKNEEIKVRLENKDFGGEKTVIEKINPNSVRTYDKVTSVPLEFKKGKIHVDLNTDSLLLPFFNVMIPFSGNLIKSITKSDDQTNIYLRINFHNPISGSGRIAFNQIVKMKDPVFIKDLTFKSRDKTHFEIVFKNVNELIKRVKNKEKELKNRSNIIEQEPIQLNKNMKKITLEKLCLRPTFTGKTKTEGVLEAHINGFRFQSTKNERVDIVYRNIKHAFVQTCENELIVIMHFNLKNPILVGKKKRDDIQFVREIGTQADTIKMNSRSDYEEYELELQEQRRKEKYNQEFLNFAEKIKELNPKLEFDMPFRDFAFEGSPYKSSLWLMPTKYAIISLVETPFFVLSFDDIELVYFERVFQGVKNFDIAIVFRNLNKEVHRISSIPISYLESIKTWLDHSDILFMEGTNPLNWVGVIEDIKKFPSRFIEDGCWNTLHHDIEESEVEEDSEEEGDPSFEVDEDEEDEYDGEDEEDEDEESEYDEESEFEDEELSEEGLSWDEMDKKLIENEKKQIVEKRNETMKKNGKTTTNNFKRR